MKRAGVDFWAITTGNEPLNGNTLKSIIPTMSLGWTAGSQVKNPKYNFKYKYVEFIPIRQYGWQAAWDRSLNDQT